FRPVHVTPWIGTIQMVFSSHIFKASSGSRVVLSRVRGTWRISICQSWANFSHTTWKPLEMTKLGLSVGLPWALRLSLQRNQAATPPSIQASLEPMANAPDFHFACSGEFHRLAMMLIHLAFITAIRGYSVSSI